MPKNNQPPKSLFKSSKTIYDCPSCKASNFGRSIEDKNKCQFCDGTWGGHPPELVKVDIPECIIGVEVDWHLSFSNPAELKIIANADLGEWSDKVYDYIKSAQCYIAQNNGLFDCHHHGDFIKQREDGVWITRQDEGYGGRAFNITMSDGRKASLLGPWHSSPPKEFKAQNISYKNVLGKFPSLFFFGLSITEDLWRTLADKYVPELTVIRSDWDSLAFDKNNIPEKPYFNVEDKDVGLR